ncbi:MAG TPA: hypothetical protein VGK26_04295 [Thermoanaerobaculia bacterium]|jgi:hypothetical protein
MARSVHYEGERLRQLRILQKDPERDSGLTAANGILLARPG